MKKIITLAIAAAALTANAAPRGVVARTAVPANLERAAASTFVVPGDFTLSRADGDISGTYLNGVYEVVTDNAGEPIFTENYRINDFEIVADPDVKDGYIIKNLFYGYFYDEETPGTINDLKATYNPLTRALTVPAGQVLTSFDFGPGVGVLDLLFMTANANGNFDDKEPVLFAFDGLGQLKIQSPVIAMMEYDPKQDAWLGPSLFSDFIAYIPNGEMSYVDFADGKEYSNEIYALAMDGGNFVFNMANIDPFSPAPFMRENDNKQAYVDQRYVAASKVMYGTLGSQNYAIDYQLYLTAIDDEGNPVGKNGSDFWLDVEIPTYTTEECVMELPAFGFFTETDINYGRFSNAVISFDPCTLAGIETVEATAASDAAPVYYNLQGVRVENPRGGIFICRKGNTATKVLVK